MAGADPALDGLAERVRALQIEAEDLAGELRSYLDGLEADPARLHEVEERLDAYERVKRKHGGTVAAVLEHAERCRAERDRLEGAEVALERAAAELSEAQAERADRWRRSSRRRRREAAPRLAERVREELAALAMEGASFSVELEPREEIGPSGAERVELLLAPNPGVPAAPVRESASGGELSRVMLALMTAAGEGGTTTLVFDEVDAGVGGQTARAVAERLRVAGGHAPGAVHHPPAPDRRARRAPLPHREELRSDGEATSRARAWSRSRTTGWWRSCAACSAPRARTPERAATPRNCWRQRHDAGSRPRAALPLGTCRAVECRP